MFVTSSAGPATWRAVTIRAGIAVYWLAMFLATHLPVAPVVERLPTTDKHLHFGAYFGLGFILPWWSGAPVTRHIATRLWLLLLTYAAIDELLQIPVGRSAEWGDWLADAAGGLVGIALATVVLRRMARATESV